MRKAMGWVYNKQCDKNRYKKIIKKKNCEKLSTTKIITK
jgi:hypothetical protein